MRRKLAELWKIGDDYHLLINVAEFHITLTKGDLSQAEMTATYEMIEALRKIVAESDANKIRIEKELPGP